MQLQNISYSEADDCIVFQNSSYDEVDVSALQLQNSSYDELDATILQLQNIS